MCVRFRSTLVLLQGQLGPKTTKSYDSIVFTSVCSTGLLWGLGDVLAVFWMSWLVHRVCVATRVEHLQQQRFFPGEFLSVQDGVCMLRKAHMRFTLFLNVAFQTVPVSIWLMMALSLRFKEYQVLPLSMPLSFRQLLVLGFVPAGSVWSASSVHASLLQVIDGVMPLALCLQVVSEGLLLSTPLSSRWSMVWCPWLCACR